MNNYWFNVASDFIHCNSLRTFRSCFGVEPKICSYTGIVLNYNQCISKPIHLLWTLNFLKEYSVLHSLAAKWDVCTNTFSEAVWNLLINLENQLHEVCMMLFSVSVKLLCS